MSTRDTLDAAGTASLSFLEDLFERFQHDPASVPDEWRPHFAALQREAGNGGLAQGNGGRPPAAGGVPAGPVNGKLVTPDGIATAHALAIANGDVRLPAAPAGEAKPLPLPSAAEVRAEERVAFLQDRVDQLVRAYRVRGHLMAEIDPLGRPRPGLPELDPRFYHLTEEDMDRSFSTDTIEGPQSMSLRQIIQRLRNTYCRSIGVQFMHMDDL
ncbi:MAG: 2-oxoglutarate dehydrogenase E1 subunit family protein, partial [Planctomycetia bacterium]